MSQKVLDPTADAAAEPAKVLPAIVVTFNPQDQSVSVRTDPFFQNPYFVQKLLEAAAEATQRHGNMLAAMNHQQQMAEQASLQQLAQQVIAGRPLH